MRTGRAGARSPGPDSADAMVTAEVRGRRRETSVADNTPVEADTRRGEYTLCAMSHVILVV